VFLLFAHAAGSETVREPFPRYEELCGYPLIAASTPHVATARQNSAGEAVIVLDPILDLQTEKHRRVFMIAHECAHHRLGHVDVAERRKRRSSPNVVQDHELSADCWAAETLARIGLTDTLRIMESRFYRAGLYSPGGGYPAGVQRATIISECARSGRQLREASLLPLSGVP
jgi:hypothetical protein